MAMEDMPPGFRFYPTEDELVAFYLHYKLEGRRQDLNQVMNRIIPVLDIYEYNPWDLPQFAGELCQRAPEEWFFFIPMQEREARGGRPNRLTVTGYWKATGCPGYVYSPGGGTIGVKRTMVFYEGRAPAGRKTEWKMNEYKAIEGEAASSGNAVPKLRHEFSLCRVYKKSRTLRAFDRRPSGGVMTREAAAVQQPNGDHEAPTTSSQHQNNPTAERTSSPESSSSGGHARPSQADQGSANWEMDVDNEFLWDWEQLDWF